MTDPSPTAELVERLRTKKRSPPWEKYSDRDCIAAADALTSQAAEIARMREALERSAVQFAAISNAYGNGADAAHLMHMASCGQGQASAALNGEPAKPRQFLKDALDEDRRNRP